MVKKIRPGFTYISDSSELEVRVLNNPYGIKYKLQISTKYGYIEVKYYELKPEQYAHWRVK